MYRPTYSQKFHTSPGTASRSSCFAIWHGLFALMLTLSAFSLPRTCHADTIFKLHNFDSVNGDSPSALIQASDGNFYGTTFSGGDMGSGTVFQITTGGAFKVLYSFSDMGTDGYNPASGLIQANDGNLYGTTLHGGIHDTGTVFRITTAGDFVTLYNFGGPAEICDPNDGAYPYSDLLQAHDGALYGTTLHGGLNDAGTVFRITTAGEFTILYGFDGDSINPHYGDSINPHSGLIQTRNNVLYGTALHSGRSRASAGAIYGITTDGTYFPLHYFDITDGSYPLARLLQGNDGYLYGTTQGGVMPTTISEPAPYWGAVYQISTDGSVFNLLHIFTNLGSDGATPAAGLLQTRDGSLYGTTLYGGASNAGTIFKISPDGEFTTVHSFTGADGKDPGTSLTQAADGNLYGTTGTGGLRGYGTVFQIATGATVTGLFLSPNQTIGSKQNALGTVTLSDPAPRGGAVIALSSANTGAATVPASVIVQEGETSTTFPIFTKKVPANVAVRITTAATFNVSKQSAVLTVAPIPVVTLTSLSVQPGSVTGGQKATGTVTLSNTAPAGGIVITLASSNTSAATVAASVTVPPGYSTVHFTVTGKAVTANTNLTLAATYKGIRQTTSLTVNPVAVMLTAIGVTPNPVLGGYQNPTGTVTLSGQAPTGGVVVSLSSSNTGVATLPASVTVPAGSNTASFTVTTKEVPANVTTRITATYNGGKQQVVLTVRGAPHVPI